MRHGVFPASVTSVDENFIVVKRRANISLSGDLRGFHLYGADICIVADILGYNSYVIDFHLRHLGGGLTDASFNASRTALVKKYARSFRSRWITSTCTIAFLSGIPLVGRVLNGPLITRGIRRLLTTVGFRGGR